MKISEFKRQRSGLLAEARRFYNHCRCDMKMRIHASLWDTEESLVMMDGCTWIQARSILEEMWGNALPKGMG